MPCFIASQDDTAPKRYRGKSPGSQSFITSQGDTAPKHAGGHEQVGLVSLPVRVTLLQNWGRDGPGRMDVSLPVRVTLLQNEAGRARLWAKVSLPVRVTLLQNEG